MDTYIVTTIDGREYSIEACYIEDGKQVIFFFDGLGQITGMAPIFNTAIIKKADPEEADPVLIPEN